MPCLAVSHSTSATQARRRTPRPSPSSGSMPRTRSPSHRSRSGSSASTRAGTISPRDRHLRRCGPERRTGTRRRQVLRPRRDPGGPRGLGAKSREVFRGGALATGASLEIVPKAAVLRVPHRRGDGGSVPQQRRALGVSSLLDGRDDEASTDMATCHWQSFDPPASRNRLAPAVNHQAEFAAAAASPAADRAVLDGAVAMAWTTIDLAEKRPCGNASARRRTGTREAAA